MVMSYKSYKGWVINGAYMCKDLNFICIIRVGIYRHLGLCKLIIRGITLVVPSIRYCGLLILKVIETAHFIWATKFSNNRCWGLAVVLVLVFIRVEN